MSSGWTAKQSGQQWKRYQAWSVSTLTYPLACEHSLHAIWKTCEKSGESRTRKETRVWGPGGRKEIFAARSRFLLLLASLAITGKLARRLPIRKRNHCNVHFTPRKVIHDSFGFWIPRHWFRILSQWKSDSGFQSLVGSKFLELYSRFHKKTVWIPDSGLPYMGLLIDCKETLIAR